MAIPFYYNPATNELELTADPSPLRTSLGKRFGLNEISTARETLSPTKSYASKLGTEYEDIITLDDYYKWKANTKILEDFDVSKETMHKDGGRIGVKKK